MTAGNQWNLCCPECGRGDEVDIAATVWVRLCPDGTDATLAHNGDHEWNDDSPAHCNACDFQGRVRHLRQNEADPELFLAPEGIPGDNGEW